MTTHRNNVTPIHRERVEAPGPTEGRIREIFADGSESRSSVRELLAVCGDLDALALLDTEPLSEGALDVEPLTGRAIVLADLVHQAMTQFAAWEVEMDRRFGRERVARLDDETVLAIRRLLRRAADRSVLPKRSSDARVAAAITWIVLMGNMTLTRRGRLSARDIWHWFGVSDAAGLGRSIANDLGMMQDREQFFSEYPWTPIELGDVRLLTSAMRRWLIDHRDVMVKVAEDRADREERSKPMRRIEGGSMQLQGRGLVVSSVLKIDVDGRHGVALFAGTEREDPDEILWLTVPDAQALRHRLDTALAGPATPGRHGDY